MAAPFGLWEVNFPSSRAVYEEDEEEEDESSQSEDASNTPSFLWSPCFVEKHQISSPIECSLLLIAVGDVATAFVDAHFLTAGNKAVALITSDRTEKDFETVNSTYSCDKTARLHCLTKSEEVVFFQCKGHVPQEKAFNWTEKLFENLKPSRVVILTSTPACDYHTSNPLSLKSDFVKMLKTDLWQESVSRKECAFLEPPNIVSGLAASVLSYCQIYRLQAALFVCFTESSHVDSQSVEAFQFLLKIPPLNSVQQASDEEVTKILKSLGHGKLFENNMYM